MLGFDLGRTLRNIHSDCRPTDSLPGDWYLKFTSFDANFFTIKQIVYYIKNTTVLYNYWYFVMATYFSLSLDHLQASVLT
jgi:hypothetical protein